jgi:uncharacterized Zn-binding protein involved in type VI secretion
LCYHRLVGAPAVTQGDAIVGTCPNHVVPGPLGAPVPAPGLPFNAPLTQGTVVTVLVGGRPAAAAGASGYNAPPHVGLHPADPFLVPPAQVGTVLAGSSTVLVGGTPAVATGASSTCCVVPGTLTGSAATVLVAT